MDETFETVLVEYDEQRGVGSVTLNRPESLNALNGQLSREIVEGLQLLEERGTQADGDVDLRVAVISGAGEKAFCAGADIGGFSADSETESTDGSVHEFVPEFPVPVVAKIDGYCLGGGLELALACDIRLASADSEFGFPEVNLGLLPGAGGVQFVSKLCGPATAMELAMRGEHVSAEWADSEGLVNHVYPTEEFETQVESFVTHLAGQAPLAVQAIKKSAHKAVRSGLDEGRQYDRQLFAELLGTEDFAEGAAAFQTDREPEFKGR